MVKRRGRACGGRKRRFYKKKVCDDYDYDSDEDAFLEKYRKCPKRSKARCVMRRRASSRTGDMARLSVGELKADAKKVLPIYEVLEDSNAVEAFLKKRLAEFTYLRDKFSQMTVEQILAYWNSPTNLDERMILYNKIAGLYKEMKKIAKEVNKEIKQEYTSTLASKYTIESIMLIFRKAAAGMKSMRGNARFGTTNKCPNELLSQKQRNMRQALKGIKVGSAAARTAMAQVGGNNRGSRARVWKKCVTALEAICLDPNMINQAGAYFYTMHKKWGIQLTASALEAVRDEPNANESIAYKTGGSGSVTAGVSSVKSDYLASTSSAKKLFY